MVLVCRARTRLCALPLTALLETMRPLPATPLAGAPPFVRGVAVIRGAAVPVVDLGALLGANDEGAPARYVTVKVGERRAALAVEEVLGFRAVPSTSHLALPGLLKDARREAVEALARLDKDLLLVLDAARLVPEDVLPPVTPGAAP